MFTDITAVCFFMISLKIKKLGAFQICEYGHFHGNLSVHFVHETRRDNGPEIFPFSYSNAHNFFIFKAIVTKLGSIIILLSYSSVESIVLHQTDSHFMLPL